MNTTTDPNNVALISSLYSSIGTGDVPTALGLMDEKIIWNEAESNSLADGNPYICLLYTSPSPRDRTRSRMPSSA